MWFQRGSKQLGTASSPARSSGMPADMRLVRGRQRRSGYSPCASLPVALRLSDKEERRGSIGPEKQIWFSATMSNGYHTVPGERSCLEDGTVCNLPYQFASPLQPALGENINPLNRRRTMADVQIFIWTSCIFVCLFLSSRVWFVCVTVDLIYSGVDITRALLRKELILLIQEWRILKL